MRRIQLHPGQPRDAGDVPKENPLEWKQNWTLSAETFQTLCAVGYTEHGECKEWRAAAGFETDERAEEEVASKRFPFG